MEFLELFELPFTVNIIDIGGGDSHLVDALLEKGFKNIWVLDILQTHRKSKATIKRKSKTGALGSYRCHRICTINSIRFLARQDSILFSYK